MSSKACLQAIFVKLVQVLVHRGDKTMFKSEVSKTLNTTLRVKVWHTLNQVSLMQTVIQVWFGLFWKGYCHMCNSLTVNYHASVWPGSVRRGAGGAVFLHPVCSNLSRAAKTGEQRRMDRAANDTPLLAWNISNNKYRRQPYIKPQPLAFIWRDKYTSCVPIGWIYHSEGESGVFVCDELANQHLIVGSCLLANIFVANGANFLVALAPAVT